MDLSSSWLKCTSVVAVLTEVRPKLRTEPDFEARLGPSAGDSPATPARRCEYVATGNVGALARRVATSGRRAHPPLAVTCVGHA